MEGVGVGARPTGAQALKGPEILNETPVNAAVVNRYLLEHEALAHPVHARVLQRQHVAVRVVARRDVLDEAEQVGEVGRWGGG